MIFEVSFPNALRLVLDAKCIKVNVIGFRFLKIIVWVRLAFLIYIHAKVFSFMGSGSTEYPREFSEMFIIHFIKMYDLINFI